MFRTAVAVCVLQLSAAAPQPPPALNGKIEIADVARVHKEDTAADGVPTVAETAETVNQPANDPKQTRAEVQDDSTIVTVYRVITEPIKRIISVPKVNNVLRNIGTCVVNGAMDIISYYLPAPFIPIIASAAGLVIPFEPIVMLKQRMPVTSYRRAFKTAMNSFMSTFDKYKVEDEYDPYMTRRFNGRFGNDDGRETAELSKFVY